jgi:NOL1/NOP2/fmu family ribosome biogenesis protein
LLTFVRKAERQEIVAYFSERFGIPAETFGTISLLEGQKTMWAVSHVQALGEILRCLKIEAAGVPLVRRISSGWKPTTAGFQLVGQQATRNVVDLDDEDMERFLEDGILHQTLPLQAGYVIVRWNGKVLGCGLYGRPGLQSQIPGERLEPFRRKTKKR